MTKQSPPILFFGTEDFSLIALQQLVNDGYAIAAVITKPDTKKGRGQRIIPPAVKVFAEAHHIPVWQPAKLTDIAADIAAFPHPVGVLVSFGKIIPQSIIDLFTPGIINVHPSLLPLYRGPSPIEAAILHGDTTTGVSIMQLSARMDAGPVYRQQSVTLNGDETAPMLYDQLGNLGATMLSESLPAIIDGSLPAIDQDEAAARYCALITKQDSQIDWQRDTARTIERKIRAYQAWPQCRAMLGPIDCIITQAHIDTTTPDTTPGTLIATSTGLSVTTADGVLALDTVKPIGKNAMPIDAFLRGYRTALPL